MKKVTVLCLALDQEQALEELRSLGVIHLEHIQPPEGSDVEQARAALTEVERALEVLPKHHDGEPGKQAAADVVEQVGKLLDERKTLLTSLDMMRQEERRIAPFGSFDPAAIHRLEQEGIQVRLYQVGARDELDVPEGTTKILINENKDGRYFVVVSQGELDIGIASFRLPEQPLNELRHAIAKSQQRVEEIEQTLSALGDAYKNVDALRLDVEDRLRYAEARAGMGAQQRLAYLQGYCPAEEQDRIRDAARQNGWGIVITEPADDDPVPTKIENPKWIKPIKAIFDMTGLIPGYEETDISMPFLVFLSIFFAMLVGDAGYGALFVIITWFARRKMPKAPAYPFSLLYIMSYCTIVWGVLTGTYFGITKSLLPIPYSNWLNNDAHVMTLCFLIGAVQLSVAHLWNAARLRNSPQALAQLGWVCSTWTMFFVARTFVLGKPFPPWAFGLLAVGLVLIIVFMTPARRFKEEWFNHAMLPLTVIGNFTDVVSYLRLFAVGTASFAVANAFNNMLSPMFGNVIGGLIGALLLFGGHALNIALCGLGILVHGVRLNTLEFSSHVGMQWTGQEYSPFARRGKGDLPAEPSSESH
jgi:V/A-type H+-transporting ATPase subunit I